MNSFDVVKNLITTEKGTQLEQDSKYLFLVNTRSNKIQIRKAIEDIYRVKVKTVNTMVVPGKLKRVRQALGRTSDWKKAIVTLKAGHKIEIK